MRRREFLAAMPLAAMMTSLPAIAQTMRLKITDLKVVPLKVLGESGRMTAAWDPEVVRPYLIGGGSVLEIHTDQGMIGIAPGIDQTSVDNAKARLMGKDPFDIASFAGMLRYYVGGRAVASIEIALWDLLGKAANQPLYKLWGAQKDRVPAYASMVQLSTPTERARLAVQLKSQGWRAMKLRLHYETMREDIAVVEAVRKAVGDDFTIMVDANQAQSATGWQPGVRWDFRRALATARELERLNVYWLEEPLNRYDWQGLAELNKEVGIMIVGGENNVRIDEFRTILENRVFDLVQPDIMVADGVTGFREVGALAQAYGVPVVPHHGGGNIGTVAQLHAIASWPNAPWIEILHDPPVAAYTVGFAIMERHPILDRDGCMPLPQGPGLGVGINRAMVS